MIKHLTAFFTSIATASCFAATPAPQFTLITDALGSYPQLLQFLKNQNNSKEFTVGTLLLNLQNPGDVNSGAKADFCLKNCPNGQPGAAIQFLVDLSKAQQAKTINPTLQVFMLADVETKYPWTWEHGVDSFKQSVDWIAQANAILAKQKVPLRITGLVYDKQSSDIPSDLVGWSTNMKVYMQESQYLKTLGLIGGASTIELAANNAIQIDKYYAEMYNLTANIVPPSNTQSNQAYTYIDAMSAGNKQAGKGDSSECLNDPGTLPGDTNLPTGETDPCTRNAYGKNTPYSYPDPNTSLYTLAASSNNPVDTLFPQDAQLTQNNGQNLKFLVNHIYADTKLNPSQLKKVVFLFSTESYGIKYGCVAQPNPTDNNACGEIAAFGSWAGLANGKADFIQFADQFGRYYTTKLSGTTLPATQPVTNVGIYQVFDVPCAWTGTGVCKSAPK